MRKRTRARMVDRELRAYARHANRANPRNLVAGYRPWRGAIEVKSRPVWHEPDLYFARLREMGLDTRVFQSEIWTPRNY
jgi:hypothetical protein